MILPLVSTIPEKEPKIVTPAGISIPDVLPLVVLSLFIQLLEITLTTAVEIA